VKLITEAKAYLISRSEFGGKLGGWSSFCDDEGLKESIEETPQGIPEVAGRLCYMSFNAPRPGGNAAYLQHIKESGHGSVLEHVVWGFIFTGVSRSLTHELVRHRAGFGFSQLSQRYVDESDVAFVVPVDLQEEVAAALSYRGRCCTASGQQIAGTEDPDKAERAGIVWLEAVEDDLKRYGYLADHLADKFTKELEPVDRLIDSIRPGGLDLGPTPPDLGRKARLRKRARQTARSVLPNCTETKIYVTGNARAWRNFIEQRGSKHADAEIRRLAYKVWRVLAEEAPYLFGDYAWTLQDGKPLDVTTPYRKV
jgi:thymidylate synthase (FAD)